MSAHESSSGRFGYFFSSMPMWLPSTKLVLAGNGFIIQLGISERSSRAARKNWPHLQPGEIKMHSNFTCFRSDGIIIILNRNCYGNRFWVITQLCARFQLFEIALVWFPSQFCGSRTVRWFCDRYLIFNEFRWLLTCQTTFSSRSIIMFLKSEKTGRKMFKYLYDFLNKKRNKSGHVIGIFSSDTRL